MPELTAARLIELGIAPMCGLDEALAAFEAAAWLGQPRGAALPVLIPGDPVAPAVSGEAEGKAALAGFGLDVPRSARAACLDRVAEISRAVGYPQVLKGEGLAHKTEAGAVALNLSTAADAEKAARAMPCASFLLEEMITGTIAELLVGVVRDPAHGFVLTLAAGGTLSEILRDSVSLLVPVTGSDIRQALGNLRIAPLLAGYRNGAEVEINPLICTPERAVAADVLIRIGESNDG
jgi:hypothetical protein